MLYGTDDDNTLTERIIGCAIEVHKELGPGLLESVYEQALCCELRHVGLEFRRQIGVPLYYKGELISEYRPDPVVADRVVVEVKSVARLEAVFTAQLLTYLQVMKLPIGLLLNFNSVIMKHGVRRVMR
jgi:GxxExxY protein